MRHFSIELPKYRLELNARLVKRRKPLVAEPLLPTPKVVNKKYRKGTLIGKAARHLSEHKNAKKVFIANLSALAITGSMISGANAQTIQKNIATTPSDETVIQVQNTLRTQKAIQYPLGNVRINQGFSYYHPGADLGASVGDPIKPVKAGTIIEAGYATDGYGNTIVVDHGNGLTSRYAHLSKIFVKLGQYVTTDNVIGLIGLTGHTTGPHLHLEIRQNGTALNPLQVLAR